MGNSSNILLQTIVSSFTEQPRDVSTTPRINTTPRWFYVYSDGNDIYIESGRTHLNKSKISNCITLDKQNVSEIYKMYGLYRRGIMPRNEIRDRNRFSSYWFGIFDDLQL